MKILYYSAHPSLPLYAKNGSGTHMREMINAMRELGHEVQPLIIADKRNPPCFVKGSGKTGGLKGLIKKIIPGVVWRSFKEFRLLQLDRKAEAILLKEIDRFQPDMVYERAAYLQLSGVNAVKKKKCLHYMEINAPFINEVEEFEKAPTIWKSKARRAEYWQVTSPDKVYVVSNVLKRYYMRYMIENKKIEVLPNCVNTSKAICNQELKDSLRKKFGLEAKTVIGFVGSIFPYHGIDLLIRGFATTAKEKPEAVLMIVGDGATIPELKDLSRKLGLEDRVIFTGSVPNEDIFSYIDLIDIAVMVKSNWYGSPVKLFEYGAMKKPIVAPLTEPVLDVMEKGVHGLLIQSDEISVSSAINSLITDKKLRSGLANAFHEKVTQQHTWHKAAEAVLSSVFLKQPNTAEAI
jgi:glycosyltransferase involved in cell wall biosynthesis